MKKVDFNSLIQLLGMIGIIGSLLFVGLEMRQSQRIALAGQQQDRMAVFVDITNTFTEAGIEFNSLEPEKAYAFRNYIHASFYILENDVVQYNLGLMEEGIWEVKQNAMKRMMGFCTAREVFNSRRSQLDARLVILAKQAIINDCIDIASVDQSNRAATTELFENYLREVSNGPEEEVP
ncbi:MAG: hypothetical protein CMQ07_10955 [Gammaproteobacteria bacterium]|nr:hypothetical protein [Gammaproteobacteria bacterium]